MGRGAEEDEVVLLVLLARADGDNGVVVGVRRLRRRNETQGACDWGKLRDVKYVLKPMG